MLDDWSQMVIEVSKMLKIIYNSDLYAKLFSDGNLKQFIANTFKINSTSIDYSFSTMR